MRAIKIIGLLVISLLPLGIFAQEPVRCSTDFLFEQQLQDPKFKRSYQKLEKAARKAEDAKRASSMPDLPITIPVIIHVIHLGEPYGVDNHLSIEYVQEAIDNANQNFSGVFSNDSINTQIDFCIANASTSGTSIEGIRYYDWNDLDFGSWSSSTFYDNNVAISNLLGYDRNNYCNIFIAPFSNPLGFAYLPPTNYGVYVGTNYFGVTNIGNFDLNRTLVHELGHYCGLFHTFYFTSSCGPETNCVAQGDRVCDTPPTTGTVGCTPISCPATLVENFMDYGSDYCMDSFTQGQALRMLSQLETLRPGVVSNTLACGSIDGIDVGVSGLNIPNLGCNSIQDIEFILTNYGDTLTEATINYTINNEESFIIWTGNLGFGESETITIPNYGIGYGLVDIEINVDALGDTYTNNNTQLIQLDNYEGSLVDLEIILDGLPYGFSWDLINVDTEELVDDGGPYGNELECTALEFEFCLPEGNYELILDDIFGNGLHYYCANLGQSGTVSVINSNDTLAFVWGNWGGEEILPFYIPPCSLNADCPWDVNGSGIVDVGDILEVIQFFGLTVDGCNLSDVNQDGIVGVDDLLDVIAVFGYNCSLGIVPPQEEDFGLFFNKTKSEIIYKKLYNIQGQEILDNKPLESGIYIEVIKWSNEDITRKKIYYGQ